MKQFHSNVRGSLPDVSATHLGIVQLPEGRLIVADEDFTSQRGGRHDPCLWVSQAPVTGVAKLVTSLVGAFETNGLWPLVLTSLEGDDDRPWLTGELDPGSSTDPAIHEPLAVLQEWWTECDPIGGRRCRSTCCARAIWT